MKLPCIFIDAAWHIGQRSPDGRLNKRITKNWDYEFGLLSVSLQPEAWRCGWAGKEAVIYEVTASGRQLCFLDADNSLANHRAAIMDAAIQQDLIRCDSCGIHGTERLYCSLDLTANSELELEGRHFGDQLLQAALAVLASGDKQIDGLWWPDTLNGRFRTERGGVYQHLLCKLAIEIVPCASRSPKLSARERLCAILD
jgi:hypothetical protein